MKIKIHPGVVTAIVIAAIAVVLYLGFGYMNNQPPDVTAARIAFYKKDRDNKTNSYAPSGTKKAANQNAASAPPSR